MPTVKQLKSVVRNYKKQKCPPISKMKKPQLIKTIVKLGVTMPRDKSGRIKAAKKK